MVLALPAWRGLGRMLGERGWIAGQLVQGIAAGGEPPVAAIAPASDYAPEGPNAFEQAGAGPGTSAE